MTLTFIRIALHEMASHFLRGYGEVVRSNAPQLSLVLRYVYRQIPSWSDRRPVAVPLSENVARNLLNSDSQNVEAVVDMLPFAICATSMTHQTSFASGP